MQALGARLIARDTVPLPGFCERDTATLSGLVSQYRPGPRTAVMVVSKPAADDLALDHGAASMGCTTSF